VFANLARVKIEVAPKVAPKYRDCWRTVADSLAWARPTIALSHVYQLGPNSIRSAALAREAMTILEQHHWVVRINGGLKIDGKQHRDVWEIAAI
jgi:hypothetical protein